MSVNHSLVDKIYQNDDQFPMFRFQGFGAIEPTVCILLLKSGDTVWLFLILLFPMLLLFPLISSVFLVRFKPSLLWSNLSKGLMIIPKFIATSTQEFSLIRFITLYSISTYWHLKPAIYCCLSLSLTLLFYLISFTRHIPRDIYQVQTSIHGSVADMVLTPKLLLPI